MSLVSLKQKLARVFDDNLDTEQWHNYVDYVIMSLILLSTLEIFLSTFEGVVEKYGTLLLFVDWFTTIFFTIEVTLRIWCADLLDERYKGFWGRMRYCCSFYGIIDILSTYPFYLSFMLPVNYALLKSFRVMRVMRIMRVLRIFRFTRSIDILGRAVKASKDQMVVSFQFLTIVTILLSFILYFVEHDVQPDVYDNGWTSVLWAFMQYIGDPGGFADAPPVTFTGRIIASIIGVLGIAIFAVPAGLIASAFSDVMTEDEHEEDCKEWCDKIHQSFERKLDRGTGFYIAPKFVSVADIQARMIMKPDEIIDAINSTSDLRLINLATTRTMDEQAEDKLAVEHYPLNRPYGCCINRGSKITIMNAVACVDAITGWAAFYLAQLGGFNYISREIGASRPFRSFYLNDGEDTVPMLKEYMDDLRELAPTEDCWVITLMAASGAQESKLPTEFHFTYGLKKGTEGYDDPLITMHDVEAFDAMQKEMSVLLQDKYKLGLDCHKYYGNQSPRVYARKWDRKINAIGMRIAWSVMCWDTRTIEILKDVAEIFNKHFEPGVEKEISPELKEKDIAYDGYNI